MGHSCSFFYSSSKRIFRIGCFWNHSCRIYAKGTFFEPIDFKDACTLQSTAVCAFGDKSRWEKSKVLQALKVSGIGKYSHINIQGNQKTFVFGDVFVGKSLERKFVLENPSIVSFIKKLMRRFPPILSFENQKKTRILTLNFLNYQGLCLQKEH